MKNNMFVITRGNSWESLNKVMEAYSALWDNPFGKWKKWRRGSDSIILKNGKSVNVARLSDVDFISTEMPDVFVTHNGIWYDVNTEGAIGMMNKWLLYVVQQDERGMFIHTIVYE